MALAAPRTRVAPQAGVSAPLRVRWLGRVRFQDAHAVQQALHAWSDADHLLLLEHPHVYTLGLRASLAHILVPPASVGAELVATNRGGDVTYHGPGQLVGYPILSVPDGPGATPAYVRSVEQLVIDACTDVGLPGTGRLEGLPGVWVDPDGPNPRKVCAIGVRRSRGRTMHGFALNVDPDLSFFGHIVPCGIPDKAVTSLAAEGVMVDMADVVDAVVARAGRRWGDGAVERQDVTAPARPGDLAAFSGTGPGGLGDVPVRLLGRLDRAGVDTAAGVALAQPKPPWLRAKADLGPRYREVRRTMRDLDLHTVCEEAGCPNIFECWAAGTATFMINGTRCTRACGFCLVDTRHPEPLDADEPEQVAEAVATMGLAHAVVTAVARDDVTDGGAVAFAATIAAIRRRCPTTDIEVLVPDFGGEPDSLDFVFSARPDVFNHNLETVARLQRAVRPQASYARSLAVLARARAAGLTTKSGLIVGMGEEPVEVRAAMADLRAVGVEIVTVGQYLRPTARHLPVARWWRPEEFDDLAHWGRDLGFAHVQASPLTRSSYHAREARGAASARADR
ncbi:MAG: lipoyl synthase [Actinomycetota bacterium]|nr:lipoyl synthase [Actinomycetota bacterium]